MSAKIQMTTVSELAKMLDTRVQKINIRDPNIFQREQDEPIRNAEALAFREAIRFECEALQAEVRGNGRYLVLELKAAPNAGSWSINEPDQITLTRAVKNLSVGCAVFASGAALSPKAIEIIQQESFQQLLKELGMGAGESLNFYKNAIVYYARTVAASRFLERMNSICRFVSGLTASEKTQMRKVDLPQPFADLNDCAQQWALSDDMERTRALEKASVDDLRALVERVTPRLSSINEYLDAHPGERDAPLGSLAETACEAQITLHQSN